MIKLAGRICSAKMLNDRAAVQPLPHIKLYRYTHTLSVSLGLSHHLCLWYNSSTGLTCIWLYWEVWMTLADAVGQLCTVAKHFIICILGGNLSDIGAWKTRNQFREEFTHKTKKPVIMQSLTWHLLWLFVLQWKTKGGNMNVLVTLVHD